MQADLKSYYDWLRELSGEAHEGGHLVEYSDWSELHRWWVQKVIATHDASVLGFYNKSSTSSKKSSGASSGDNDDAATADALKNLEENTAHVPAQRANKLYIRLKKHLTNASPDGENCPCCSSGKDDAVGYNGCACPCCMCICCGKWRTLKRIGQMDTFFCLSTICCFSYPFLISQACCWQVYWAWNLDRTHVSLTRGGKGEVIKNYRSGTHCGAWYLRIAANALGDLGWRPKDPSDHGVRM